MVYQIAEDEDGVFWLTTNNGLARFDLTSGAVKYIRRRTGCRVTNSTIVPVLKIRTVLSILVVLTVLSPSIQRHSRKINMFLLPSLPIFSFSIKRCGLVLRIRRYRKILLSRISCYSVRSKILFFPACCFGVSGSEDE